MKDYFGKAAMVLGLVVLVFFVGFFLARSSDRSTIEEWKVYKLGYTYLANLDLNDGKGGTEAARVFDFSDRNLPERSIIVPLADANSIPLVERNPKLPASSIRKVRIRVAGRTIEGVEYPAYEFVRWEFNPGTTETQSVVPKMKPRS